MKDVILLSICFGWTLFVLLYMVQKTRYSRRSALDLTLICMASATMFLATLSGVVAAVRWGLS